MRLGLAKSILFLAITGMFLGLSGCGRQSPDFHLDNMTGGMPDLKLFGAKNAQGKVRSAADYRGRVVILYFGYTHCPDICPLTLSKLHQVMQRLGPAAREVQVLFVTVDPMRDTPAVLRRYIAAFDPRFGALRPTGQALGSLTRRYRIAYDYGKPGADGDYPVGHSSGIFIFDQHGRIRLIGTNADKVADIASDIQQLVQPRLSWWHWWW